MKKFIHEENLRLFRKQLAETTDPKKRQVLLKLLAEEEAQDDPLSGNQSRPRSGEPNRLTERS